MTEQLNHSSIHVNASSQTLAALRSFFDSPRGLTVDDFRYHPSPDNARRSAMLVTFCCCFSVAKSCQTLYSTRTAAHQPPLSFTVSWSLPKIHEHAMVRIVPKSAPQENLKTWKSRARYFVVRIASIQHGTDCKHVAKVGKGGKGRTGKGRRKKGNKSRLLG